MFSCDVTVWWEQFKGDNNLARYSSNSKVEAVMFETLGLIGGLSALSAGNSLWIFAAL